MKKLLILLLVLCFIPVTSFAAYPDELSRSALTVDEKGIDNASATGVFTMEHSVARESSFKTIIATGLVDNAGITKIGRFSLANNTRDGFTLTIHSEKGGVLYPTTTGDGEIPIPYSVLLSKDGDIGEGVNYVPAFTATQLASNDPLTIMNVSAQASSATDAMWTLFVEIVDDSNVMQMAGTYHDSLQLVYTDE